MYLHPCYSVCAKQGLVLFDSRGGHGDLVLPWISCMTLGIYIFDFSGPLVSWKVSGWIRSVFLNILKAKPSDKKKNILPPPPLLRPIWRFCYISSGELLNCVISDVSLSSNILWFWADTRLEIRWTRFLSHVVSRCSFLLFEAGKGHFWNSSSHTLTALSLALCMDITYKLARAAETWPHLNAESKAAFFQSKWFLCSSKFEKGSRPLCFNLQVAILVGSLINLIGCCQQEKIVLGYIAYHMVKENNTKFLFHFCMTVPVCVYTGLKSQAKS